MLKADLKENEERRSTVALGNLRERPRPLSYSCTVKATTVDVIHIMLNTWLKQASRCGPLISEVTASRAENVGM